MGSVSPDFTIQFDGGEVESGLQKEIPGLDH